MNEFERRLARVPLRRMPASWRHELLPAVERSPAGRKFDLWEWMWPSPLAWAALVLMWIGLLGAFSIAESLSPVAAVAPLAAAVNVTATDDAPPTLLAYHTNPDLVRNMSRAK